MGQELECRIRYGKQSLAGKVYLETDYLLFRGDKRVKIAFRDLTSVEASNGVLRLEFAGGPVEMELGNAAERWAEKILHPPSRLDKLGVKAGSTVRLVGQFDAEFVQELGERGAVEAPQDPEIVFYAAARRKDLARVGEFCGAALWVIYPKGAAEIREIEVIDAGRAAGMKDVKVARFSETHTGLKFVSPARSGKR
jgi:hypothetical protein